ncbi:hypothetical protein AGABI2DRAFT_194370 [Agaricus bisporus var. bisporus H97]|uniref:hypothetical protein n=1 Tax=Agaricus bisporus var. bisporus (strain H97 / ATCC MYA-4626 / FGSC 10389) TaxID=936046 RepID=UPI00029F6E6F|nr:hypothetical protein AGABI2DRAFT_194370 [Agaricus bisporus var. bisporus H97]EKV45449.1 hypothetical protein AGABI2DRAFT_194370 [Agaricus bisporus var. bisporus H97]
MDPLFDDDFPVQMPFPNTAVFTGHRFLCEELLRSDGPKRVLDPLPPTFGSSDEGSSDDDEPITMDDFSPFDGVTSAYAPAGQVPQNPRFDYKVKDGELATDPPAKKIFILAPNDDMIRVVPRCFPRKKITRACVELAVCQWMEDQHNLPPNAPNRVLIPTGVVEFVVDGEIWRAPVWLWKGLEQVPERPETFKLHI